jgi:hypothetical protein
MRFKKKSGVAFVERKEAGSKVDMPGQNRRDVRIRARQAQGNHTGKASVPARPFKRFKPGPMGPQFEVSHEGEVQHFKLSDPLELLPTYTKVNGKTQLTFAHRTQRSHKFLSTGVAVDFNRMSPHEKLEWHRQHGYDLRR